MRGRITPRVCDKTAMLPTYIMTHIVTMHIIHSNLIYHSEWYIYINPFTFERLPTSMILSGHLIGILFTNDMIRE